MSKAIRKATNVFVSGARLYRELAVSAFSIMNGRRPQRAFKGI